MSPYKDSSLSGALGTIAVASLLLSGFSVMLQAGPSGAEAGRADYAPWWDYSWVYRKAILLDNSQNPKSLTDYQLLLNLSVQDLIDAGKMRADQGDMRFSDADGTTALSYWVETAGSLWLKVPSIPASSKKTIYLYYGNPAAVSASNGSKTFDVFDHFEGNALDSSTWLLIHAGAYSVSGSEFRIAADGSLQPGKAVAQTASQENNYVLRSRFKITGGVHIDERIGLSIKCGSSDGRGYNYVLRDFTGLDEISFLDDYVQWNTRAGNWLKDTWYVEEICHDGSNVKGRLNDGAWQTQGWTGRSGYPALYFGSYDGSSVWDYALVRKFSPPDPKAALGAEERPIKFLSADCSHEKANEGDLVTLNVTFNNPTDDPMTINVSFREGEVFAEARRLSTKEVALGPRRDTRVQEAWPAQGGDTALWVALGDFVLASFPLSVNWYPALDYIPDQRLLQDQPYLLRLAAKDRGGDPLVWSEDCPIFNFTKTNSTGAEAAFKPTNEQVGFYTVHVSVEDPRGCRAVRAFNLTVVNQNDPPWLDYIPNLVAYEDQRYSYRVNATDPDTRWGDTLTFSDDCGLFDIDPLDGSFSFVPSNAQVGRYLVEITVRDNQSVSAGRMFNLTVQNQNDPPEIEPIPPQTATQGKLWQVMARAGDPDQSTPQGDRLRFSDDSPLFDIGPDTGLVTFTPGNGHVGQWACNITVADLAGATCSTRLLLTVLNVNDPPVLEAIPDQTATEEVPFEYTARASDPDLALRLDNLTFSDDSPLLDIDPATGRLSFLPGNSDVGRHTVRVTVKDESGAAATRTFTLTVLNVNDPPVNVSITSIAEGASFREGDAIWLNGTGSDEDAGDRLLFVWSENELELGRGRSLQVKLQPGDHRVRLEVSDGNATVSSEVSFRVLRRVKEPVTVQSDWWVPLLAVVAVAGAAGGAFLLLKRPGRGRPEALPPEAGPAAGGVAGAPRKKPGKAAAGPAGPAAGAAPPPAPPGDGVKRDRARKALDSAEDALAEALESGADTTAAMESLDIARDFFKDGDFDEAAAYASEAEASLKAGGKKAKETGPDVGKLACPECSEELQPGWPACPVCGHRTR
jgi:hypothetical protein